MNTRKANGLINPDDLAKELAENVSHDTKPFVMPVITGRQKDNLGDGYEAAWRATYPEGTLKRDFTTYKRRLAGLGYDLRVYGHDMQAGIEYLSFEVD